ncbi:hypothetical protein ZOSMA_276G00080 [Zostera marina]|uniref:Pentatricopeptide repeat-containing protein n=1 Tax=Zostera marina TaxID=29655 RepID=A0A0K9PDY6_ZOSMR|nr:hypothetical protein ZOSMA_276G00080 [Zostera marina]
MPKDNVVSWNVIISGYVSNGVYFKAIDIFWRMRDSGVQPDIISFASIMSACSLFTALEQGRKIHSYISNHKLESSEVIMRALFDMYAKYGAVEEARHIFYRLQVRDIVSWTSMIMAYRVQVCNLWSSRTNAREYLHYLGVSA